MTFNKTTHAEFASLGNSVISDIELYRTNLSRHRFGKHFHESCTIGINNKFLASPPDSTARAILSQIAD